MIKTFEDFKRSVTLEGSDSYFCETFMREEYEFITEEDEEYDSDSCTKYFSYKDPANNVEFYFALTGSGTSTVYWEYGSSCEVFPQEVTVTQYTTIKPTV